MKNIIFILLILFSLSTFAQKKVVTVTAGKYAVRNFSNGTVIQPKATSAYRVTYDSTLTAVNVVDTVIYGNETRPAGKIAYKGLQRGQTHSIVTILDNDSTTIGAYGTGSNPVIQTLVWDTIAYPDINVINATVNSYQYSTTYYVSNSGNDLWSGLEPDSAWQTITKVNAATFEPGDNIFFKRGDEWRSASIIVDFSGAEGNPITIGDYGTGAKPIFNGSEVFTDWDAHPTIPNVWRTKAKTESEEAYRTVVVIDDDRFWKVVPTIYDLDADLEYCPVDSAGKNGDSIYVYSVINPSLRTAELSTKINGITDGIGGDVASTNITIKNISFKYYGYEGIDFRHHVYQGKIVGNILIDSCNFYFNKQGGAQFYNGHEYNTVQNCTVTYCGNGLYANQADYITFKNNVISNSIEFSQGVVSESFTDGHAIGMWRTKGTIVENNHITGDGTGGGIIGVDIGAGTIRYNRIFSNGAASIAVHRTNAVAGESLNIYYNELVTGAVGTPIQTDTIYTTSTVNVYNNTIVSGSAAGALSAKWSEKLVMKNNIFYSNNATYVFTQIYSGNDVTSDYNLWRKHTYYSYWALPSPANATTWAAWQAQGKDANGVDGDPLFITNFTDLRLQSGSPAIDAGVDLGFIRDILGNPIVGNPDIGAYEYIAP